MNQKITQREFLLIDTCFFIDSYSHPEVFASFLQQLKDDDCYLLTIPQVKYEFIRSKTRDVIDKKKDYFDKTIGSIIKTDKFEGKIEELMIRYGQYMDGVSVVDLYLAAVVKQMKGIALLTRNHKDFPITIFSRDEVINFGLPNSVLSYGVYY